jgi:uncharacterized OB-fold protein
MNAEQKRPLPEIKPETAPYWEAARAHRLAIQRCRSCGEHQHYPRLVCRHCHTFDLDWVDASGRGEVYSYSVVYRSPGPFAADVPYVTAVVELAEGPRMYTRIVGCDPETVRCGMPVKVRFVDQTDEITFPYFEPLADA